MTANWRRFWNFLDLKDNWIPSIDFLTFWPKQFFKKQKRSVNLNFLKLHQLFFPERCEMSRAIGLDNIVKFRIQTVILYSIRWVWETVIAGQVYGKDNLADETLCC